MTTQVVQLNKYQFVMQLKAAGKLAAFKTYISGLAVDDDVRLYWEFHPFVGRNSILVTALQADAGFTDAQVDNFFNIAGAIE